MPGEENDINLHGITVNDEKSVQAWLKTGKQKDTEYAYADQVQERIPIKNRKIAGVIPVKPKYKPYHERSGKVQDVTNMHLNKRLSDNYDKCTSTKHMILTLLLGGLKLTSAEMFEKLEVDCKANPNLREVTAKSPLSKKKIWGALNIITMKSRFKKYVEKEEKQAESGKGIELVYNLTDEGRNFTLEEAIKISRAKVNTTKKPAKVPAKLEDTLNKKFLALDQKIRDRITPLIERLDQLELVTGQGDQSLYINKEKVAGSDVDIGKLASTIIPPNTTLQIHVSGGIDIRIGFMKQFAPFK